VKFGNLAIVPLADRPQISNHPAPALYRLEILENRLPLITLVTLQIKLVPRRLIHSTTRHNKPLVRPLNHNLDLTTTILTLAGEVNLVLA
jgi:hypothetical protein